MLALSERRHACLARRVRYLRSRRHLGCLRLLGPASAIGDGAVTATEDICPGGLFAGSTPTLCGNPPATLITFATEFSSSLSDSAVFPVTSFFDIFVDLTIDGGLSGSAKLSSATVTISAVPEPDSTVLMMTALGALAMVRIRRSQ